MKKLTISSHTKTADNNNHTVTLHSVISVRPDIETTKLWTVFFPDIPDTVISVQGITDDDRTVALKKENIYGVIISLITNKKSWTISRWYLSTYFLDSESDTASC